jgi:Asp-tRNA(Asn)/Glu-tRNA(Gln) amidotransferase A subunit family amidase
MTSTRHPELPGSSAVESLDLLIVTGTELQQLLSNGSITSAGLVTAYLDQIERENHNGLKLNAMISITPYNVLQQIARDLDIEREQGVIRSPLHGIPITVKARIAPIQTSSSCAHSKFRTTS